MVIRSLVASTIVTGLLFANGASAQVLLCPEASTAGVAAADTPAEVEKLLKRLITALDLHGVRGVDEQDILQAHAETPSALLAKLDNVVDRCAIASENDGGFYEALPGLRKAFLEATDVTGPSTGSSEAEVGAEVQAVALASVEVEQSIDLSVRELWRKLWFRPIEPIEGNDQRWAVIVASPANADNGWDMLGDHQRRWVDAFFQLHEPYYESNPHHAIVVGRRLPRDQATRLRDYVIELGMADDAFLWALPEEALSEDVPGEISSLSSEVSSLSSEDSVGEDIASIDYTGVGEAKPLFGNLDLDTPYRP